MSSTLMSPSRCLGITAIMPNLRPRKDEIRRVVELLESPDFESADEMAKEMIKLCLDLFEEREWAAILWRDEKVTGKDSFLSWGPFSSTTEAERWIKRLDIGGVARALPLSSIAMMDSHIATTNKGKAKNCPNCQHPVGTHMHERKQGYCMVAKCKCKTLTKKEDKK